MAFENLYKTSEKLRDLYLKQKAIEDKAYESNDPTARNVARAAQHKMSAYLDSIVIFYETTLQHGKFVSQRHHCKRMILEMNQAFGEGYFKNKKL